MFRLIILNNYFHYVLQSRERLIRSLRAMNAGDAADQVIRQVDKMIKSADRFTRDARVNKASSDLLFFSSAK
jgi:hypothetical protein